MSAPASRRRRKTTFIGLLAVADIALLAALASGAAAPPSTSRPTVLRRDEVRSRLLATLGVDGLPSALDSLERLAASDSLVLRDAHQLAHALGREALTRSGSDPAILAQCRPAFASGCYHGVVEGLLRLRGRVDMAELQRMCLAAGGPGERGPIYECAHGVGHGVLGAVGLHVPTALHHCDSLAEPVLAVSCHEGVFMEAVTVAINPGQGHTAHAHDHEPHGEPAAPAIDPTDPYSPCDQYMDPYADSCWLFQAFVILRSVGFDAGRALRVCDAAPAERVDRCYEGVGLQVAGLFQRSDAWVAAQCGMGRSERAARCASGAALAFTAMDWSGARVRRFCALLPRDWREQCSAAAADGLALVS